MLLLLVVSMVVSAFLCAVLRHPAGLGGLGRRAYGADMPQRFHAGHVPRLGGIAMMAAATVCWLWLLAGVGLGWWLVAAIAVAAGVAEDVTLRLKVRWRLGATVGAGVAAVWLQDLRITSLGVEGVDQLLACVPWAPAALAVLAVAGLPHAFNLIDGYNGLASTVAMACCLALAYVAWQVGDRQLAAVVLVLAGATAGFLVWNYPRGLLFAGDGGAYLWGVVIAVASIQLVQRHPEVSPWFPMLMLAYPVGETVFSTYRKLARGQSPGRADALHLHQLIHRRIVPLPAYEDAARRMLARNNRTSPYLWDLAVVTVVPAAVFWRHTGVLMAVSGGFALIYVGAYLSIVRFKVPRWLR